MSTNPLSDPRAERVLDRLHRQAQRQQPALAWRFMTRLPGLLLGRGLRFRESDHEALSDMFIAIGAHQGALLYALARASGAQRIVEFGTSFGVSTIYLACAARDNGGERVIATELVPEKAARARAHWEEAGVTDWVQLLEGDALETLAEVEGPIDLLLLDGFPTLSLPVLRALEPRLRPGAMVVVDDISLFKHDLAPLIAHLSDPARGYRAASLPLDDGLLLAIRDPEAPAGARA